MARPSREEVLARTPGAEMRAQGPAGRPFDKAQYAQALLNLLTSGAAAKGAKSAALYYLITPGKSTAKRNFDPAVFTPGRGYRPGTVMSGTGAGTEYHGSVYASQRSPEVSKKATEIGAPLPPEVRESRGFPPFQGSYGNSITPTMIREARQRGSSLPMHLSQGRPIPYGAANLIYKDASDAAKNKGYRGGLYDLDEDTANLYIRQATNRWLRDNPYAVNEEVHKAMTPQHILDLTDKRFSPPLINPRGGK